RLADPPTGAGGGEDRQQSTLWRAAGELELAGAGELDGSAHQVGKVRLVLVRRGAADGHCSAPGLSPRFSLLHVDVVGQAEEALADDVAQHLRGAAAHG